MDHELLLSFLREQLAPRSDGIVKLIEVFLKTPIYEVWTTYIIYKTGRLQLEYNKEEAKKRKLFRKL
jgi:hypothetical protein